MVIVIFAVLLIVIGIVLLWQPAWLPKFSREQTASRVTQATSRVIETAKETVEKAGERLAPERLAVRRRPELAGQFKEWLSQAELARWTAVYKTLPADAAEFTAWLQWLGDKDLGDFAQELAGFCQGQGFDLAWLADAQVPAEMKRVVEETVGLYCLAAWKSHGLLPYATYRAWQSDPGNEKHLGFAQRLYSRLIAEGLATARSDLLYAPEKERHAFVVQSMQTVATQDPKTFAILLRDAATVAPAAETTQPPTA
ncbi:MAG: hypothetical protein KGJ80_13190 [Chloroflexota bacterium]|nr:hypothetical protein [Chloroflexota bacterium]